MTGPLEAPAVGAAEIEAAPIAVHLCEHLQQAGRGLDLVEIARRLEEAAPRVRTRIISELCDRPIDSSTGEAGDVHRLVLGLCRDDFAVDLEMPPYGSDGDGHGDFHRSSG